MRHRNQKLVKLEHVLGLRDRHINQLYEERDKCLSLIARMALELGLLAGIGIDPIEEPDWQHVLFVDLPSGQVSWHIPQYELHYFNGIPRYEKPWDLHDTGEKYKRVLHPQLADRVQARTYGMKVDTIDIRGFFQTLEEEPTQEQPVSPYKTQPLGA